MLSRPPVITADLDPFEASYYFYQRRLNQRLALPFTRYFYHKKDSPADLEWKSKQDRGEGVYTGFGKRQWADELLVGDNSHISEDNGFKRLVETTVTGEDATVAEQAEGAPKHAGHPMSRTTKADAENDIKSLDRALARTLYLVVKVKGKPDHLAWRFPQTVLVGNENLKDVCIPGGADADAAAAG